ncbi:MAG: helix-hairpin-helix domain-containing protein [Actinobacteria bacterium]|nr:helix-hairpin-helix domain-containing protein [Actinomycetota bacterium]
MSFSRKQLLVYVALGIIVVAVGARFLLSSGSNAEGQQAGVVLAASPEAPSPSPPGTPTPAEVVVDVCGAVVRPGVYRLSPEARVCDAVDLAGGATAKAELSAVNLAARLVDGQQIVIPEKGAPAGAGVTAATSDGGGAGGTDAVGDGSTALVNLNTATLEQLDALSGVGPATAQKIIDFREANGGFSSVEQLLDVSGIGDAKFAALKDLVTV